MASNIHAQRRNRSGESQKNGFRNPRLTQEVRKMTPASSRSGGSQKNDSCLKPLGGRSQNNDSCLKPLGRSQKNDFKNLHSMQEVKNNSCLKPLRGSQKNDLKNSRSTQETAWEKSEKWLQKFSFNVGSQKNDSCFKPLEGKSEKWLQKSPLNAPDSNRSRRSNKNDFRNSHSTQEVRKMTLASRSLGEKSEKWFQ
ncbi:hypothetical protein V8G54_021165 [Vigna mungo]|uniref:Uncharacterized protein n=1 Tax=Vigna mungo TaxID=3915 RepID=A0AAQ3RX47_VIGMU